MRERADLVLLDIVMSGEGGMSFLQWMREAGHSQPVIVVSALDTAHTAVGALKLGAADYLAKGFDVEELRKRVGNLLRLSTLEQENARLREKLVTEGVFGPMLGATPEMRKLFEMAARVAETDTTVLILGESGTGKDLLAQEVIHCARSPRAGETIHRFKLRGHSRKSDRVQNYSATKKGAFTGAAQQRKANSSWRTAARFSWTKLAT